MIYDGGSIVGSKMLVQLTGTYYSNVPDGGESGIVEFTSSTNNVRTLEC